jgi:hypothetical protein
MYAAEGSDWFWWYGDDQVAPGGDAPFDSAYVRHLTNVYLFAQRAGASVQSRALQPITRDGARKEPAAGATARSTPDTQTVLLTCDATAVPPPQNLFVVGSLERLGNWKPNIIPLYDDGTHGDKSAGDGIWSLLVDMPVGVEVQYKYTNNGTPGVWAPGEEFPLRNRTFRAESSSPTPTILRDIFGK